MVIKRLTWSLALCARYTEGGGGTQRFIQLHTHMHSLSLSLSQPLRSFQKKKGTQRVGVWKLHFGWAHGHTGSLQFSFLTDWIVGGTWQTIQHRFSSSVFCRKPLWTVLAWAGMSTLCVVHPAFPLPTTASPTLQGALKDGFWEAVVACNMPEPCKCPSPHSCQKRSLWTHKGVDLPPHPVVGLVLHVRDAEKFLQALGSKGWILFSESARRGQVSQP